MTEDVEIEEGGGRTPFVSWVQQQRKGALHTDLSTALAEVVAGAVEFSKAGELTLKIKVKPNGQNRLLITDEIKTKVPEGDPEAAIFYCDAEGNLSRRDPRQMTTDDFTRAREEREAS